MSNSHETPLLDLARRVGNLRPDWQRPERFYEARSELAAELRRLASTQTNPSAAARPRNNGDT